MIVAKHENSWTEMTERKIRPDAWMILLFKKKRKKNGNAEEETPNGEAVIQ